MSDISKTILTTNSLRPRLMAAFVHLCISGAIAYLLALVVFVFWYPSPQREMVGGSELFLLVVAVDVVMGPLLTAVVFNAKKTRAHLARDLSVIAALQLAALSYGAHTVWLARPAILAFEVDRYRVVTAADLEESSLKEAPPELRSLPWTGPRTVSAIKPVDVAAMTRSVELGAAGFDMGMQPFTWKPFDEKQARAMWAAAKPIDALIRQLKSKADFVKLNDAVENAISHGYSEEQLRYLPIVYKDKFWTALVTESGEIAAYATVDPF